MIVLTKTSLYPKEEKDFQIRTIKRIPEMLGMDIISILVIQSNDTPDLIIQATNRALSRNNLPLYSGG